MSKLSLAGAAALVVAPLVALVSVLVAPTASDEAGDQLAALADHRGPAIAGLALNTVAIVLLVPGMIWLAVTLSRRTPRLAAAGGILGVAGALLVVFENGVSAAAPAVVAGLDPARATAVLHAIGSSAAVSALEPLSVAGGVGLALLAVASAKAGVARWAAAAVVLGALGENVGFATGTKPLLVVAFALLLLGLAATVRGLVRGPAARSVAAPVTA
ncbi:MAG TPA: hypothetical protein VFL60_11050 [Gaiellaceae bacterium]|nr:hypothetical protein [Gaiellaceae bacterium]